MSLINDALKRANETKPTPPTGPDTGAAPLRAVEPPRTVETSGPPSWLLFLFPIVLLVVCGVAGALIYQGWRGNDASSAEPSLNASAREIAAAPAATPPPATDTSTAAYALTNNTANAQPAELTFPDLKLQGVFYRKSNPSAVVNSKTVYRGDKIDSARVRDIRQHSITVEWNGQTKVLTMD